MLAFVLACTALGLLAHAHEISGRRRRVSLGAAAAAALLAGIAMPPLTMVAKLIGALAMPTGLLWLVLGAVTLVSAAKRRWLWALPAAGLWLVFTLFGNTWIGAAWLGVLEAPYVELDPFEHEYDAVFVLGGGAATGSTGRAQATGAGDRVLLAAQLYHAGRTPLLVSSGSHVPGANATDNLAAATAELWRGLGIPPDAIIEVPGPYDTRTELQAYEELTDSEGWQQIGVVSSAWHLPRVAMHADAVGLQYSMLPADFRGTPRWEGIVSIPPSGAGFRLVQLAAWETLGRITRQ
jgi:uncharacterized SAM-binding protein YcdF (DUF218 family)